MRLKRDKMFSQSIRAPKFHPSLKLAILLSTTVILSTGPLCVLYIIDVAREGPDTKKFKIDLFLFTALCLYGLMCPIFLITYLAGLKKSVNILILRCFFCKK